VPASAAKDAPLVAPTTPSTSSSRPPDLDHRASAGPIDGNASGAFPHSAWHTRAPRWNEPPQPRSDLPRRHHERRCRAGPPNSHRRPLPRTRPARASPLTRRPHPCRR
jgi:hypothetical protein